MNCLRLTLVMALVALTPALAFAYTLGPGDEIAIEVSTAQTQLSLHTKVSVDGRIYVAPAGALVAEGKTPPELEADIAQELSDYYVGPLQVTVLVVEPKEVKVSVLGEVRQQGEQSLLDDRPLLSKAIAQAGGPSPQASLRRVSLVRKGQQIGPIDLYAALKLGRSELDVMLHSDDVIYVPARDKWVTILGAAQDQGIYELLPGDRFSDLIIMAGGLTATADQEHALIERRAADGGKQTITVNPSAALANPGGENDLVLEPMDVVRVASCVTEVYVLGEVTEPGSRPYEHNRTLLDYIGYAGGMTVHAKAERAIIVRPGSPEPTVMPVDLAALMTGRATAPPPQLEPGDIIFIPQRQIATLQDWGSIGQVLTGIAAGIRVF